MDRKFEILLQTRKNLLSLLEGLSPAQMNHIPPGFNNNLAWNLGHVIVTQQLLCYRMSDLACRVPDAMIETYRKGSRPAGSVSEQEIRELKGLALSTIAKPWPKTTSRAFFKATSATKPATASSCTA
jgi:hypothetical protein